MSNLRLLVVLAVVSGHALGHAGDDHPLSKREIEVRQVAARERHLLARNCASHISAFRLQRRAKRSLLKKRGVNIEARQESSSSVSGSSTTRSSSSSGASSTSASSTSTAPSPHYSTIQNSTCITAPEVTEGPYYINNEYVRQNLTETQGGVELVLDIGVLDINTCKPLSNAFVEIWSANATGVYGGYAAQLGGGGGGGSGGPPPSGNTTTPPGGGGGGGGPSGGSSALERNETFLRGGYATNEQGVVELVTLYPGFYSGRTAHIHTMVHLNWSQGENGTLLSGAGDLLHIGQFFFNESWNDNVYKVAPYSENTNSRTLNDADSILDSANADGNNAFLDLELLGDDVEDGILGYITVGVNASASYTIANTNYNAGNGSSLSTGGNGTSADSSNQNTAASLFDTFVLKTIGGFIRLF